MDTLVTFVNFYSLWDDFEYDDDWQLDSIAPLARSNPTARRRRNHLQRLLKLHDKVDEGVLTLDGTAYNFDHSRFKYSISVSENLDYIAAGVQMKILKIILRIDTASKI